MTMIRVTMDGRVVGKCDAKCYNATHAGCQCVCGGANHGVGIRKARLNTPRIPAHAVTRNGKITKTDQLEIDIEEV